MKRYFFIMVIILTVNSIVLASVPAQENPKGLVEVIALKGSVVFEDMKLKKGDKFQFKADISPFNQLKFSSNTDWIRVIEVKTNKIFQFYYQKKYSCSNCLFTRELSTIPDKKDSLFNLFNRNPIFLFETDTIVFKNWSINSGDNNIVEFQVVLNGKKIKRHAGTSDSIAISYQSLYGFAEKKKIFCPSFQTDSIGLICYDKKTKKESCYGLPYFHVIFLNDAVIFLKQMGLNSEEIFNELTVNYVDLKYLSSDKGFDDIETTKRWLKKEIVNYFSK